MPTCFELVTTVTVHRLDGIEAHAMASYNDLH
jgi:hypothetical protein